MDSFPIFTLFIKFLIYNDVNKWILRYVKPAPTRNTAWKVTAATVADVIRKLMQIQEGPRPGLVALYKGCVCATRQMDDSK